MDEETTQSLITAIAKRDLTARQLAQRYNVSTHALRRFVADNRGTIEATHEALQTPVHIVTPMQLEDLWITNKFERLKRLQSVAEETYEAIINSSNISPAEFSTVVREFRSYLMLAANELGQLLHRGSGDSADGEILNVRIDGVDMDQLR